MFKFGISLCLLAAAAAAAAAAFDTSDPSETTTTSKTPTSSTTPPPSQRRAVYSISQDGVDRCRGTLVGPKFIVTTAQCVYRIPPTKLEVSLKQANITAQVTHVIVHPHYRPPVLHYNVALLKLKNGQKGEHPLSKSRPGPKDNLKVDNSTEVKLVDFRKCQDILGNNLKLSSKMFCAFVEAFLKDGQPVFRSKDGKTFEPGDSDLDSDLGGDSEEIVGVYFYREKGLQVFIDMASPEIKSFIEKYI